MVENDYNDHQLSKFGLCKHRSGNQKLSIVNNKCPYMPLMDDHTTRSPLLLSS